MAQGKGIGNTTTAVVSTPTEAPASASLVVLKTGGTNVQTALSNIRASALGASLDSVGGWSPGNAANAYVITNGKDGHGVVGIVIANGVDDDAEESSANILRTLQGLIP